MDECKRDYLPISHGTYLSKKMYRKIPEKKKRMSTMPYSSTMGSIMYAILCTKSDMAYVLDITSRF